MFTLHRLLDRGYEQITRSEFPALVGLDIALLAHCVLIAQTSGVDAIDEFRRRIQP